MFNILKWNRIKNILRACMDIIPFVQSFITELEFYIVELSNKSVGYDVTV